MGRLARGADVILSPVAVEAIICAAEDGSVSEPILGRAASDESGRYVIHRIVSERYDRI